MIWASRTPGAKLFKSTLGRWRRSRPRASFMAIRASQVARLEIAAEIIEMRERPDIGFLDHVLGLAVVAQDAAGKPVEPAIVGLHDDANGRLVAPAGASDQFGLRDPGGSDLWNFCGAHDGSIR